MKIDEANIRRMYSFHLLISVILLTTAVKKGSSSLRQAVALLSEPIPRVGYTQDVVLKDIVTPWEANAYKLQLIRVRLGHAWELAALDYGFVRADQGDGIDLVHHTRKVAIEIKNSGDISSSERHVKMAHLKRFKRRHPTYSVIFAFINGPGANKEREGIRFIYRDAARVMLFGVHKERVVAQLRQAVRTHL